MASRADAVTAKGHEVRDLKAKLKAEGLSGGAINKDERVVRLVAELTALKARLHHGPATCSEYLCRVCIGRDDQARI